MCICSIELIWVSTYGKMDEKHTFWAKFKGCTGTGQSCTGTGSVLFFYFDLRSYFGHTLHIAYPI